MREGHGSDSFDGRAEFVPVEGAAAVRVEAREEVPQFRGGHARYGLGSRRLTVRPGAGHEETRRDGRQGQGEVHLQHGS